MRAGLFGSPLSIFAGRPGLRLDPHDFQFRKRPGGATDLAEITERHATISAALGNIPKNQVSFVLRRQVLNVGRSPARSSEWGFINPRRLNPRQKIIFYYLALVRRADEAGLPRKDGQTPYEYAHSLTSSLEEGKDGVEALTESFVEARYSRHDIPAKEARRMESLWETIRRVLRIVRKSRREQEHPKDN